MTQRYTHLIIGALNNTRYCGVKKKLFRLVIIKRYHKKFG